MLLSTAAKSPSLASTARAHGRMLSLKVAEMHIAGMRQAQVCLASLVHLLGTRVCNSCKVRVPIFQAGCLFIVRKAKRCTAQNIATRNHFEPHFSLPAHGPITPDRMCRVWAFPAAQNASALSTRCATSSQHVKQPVTARSLPNQAWHLSMRTASAAH